MLSVRRKKYYVYPVAGALHPIVRKLSVVRQSALISDLKNVVKGHPYYKYNLMWSKEMQNTVSEYDQITKLAANVSQCLAVTFGHWLAAGELLTIEGTGYLLDVPVNLKDEDTFHLTIEEYLHGLISLTEELARLAVNSVTLGDYQRPLHISKFVRVIAAEHESLLGFAGIDFHFQDLHAGFQLLNLKNDSLRRRSDSIKYQVSGHQCTKPVVALTLA
ncbi:MAG: hypothetical protein Q9163_001415 [Psora crenata]